MRPVNEITTDLALFAMLKKYVARLESAAKAELMSQLRRGTAYASLASGEEVATCVVVAESAGGVAVQDEAAFLEWVKANRPTAVVETVRSSDKEDILAEALRTGVLPDGVGPADSRAGYVQVKQTPVQALAITEAWMQGRVSLPIDHVIAEVEGPTEPCS